MSQPSSPLQRHRSPSPSQVVRFFDDEKTWSSSSSLQYRSPSPVARSGSPITLSVPAGLPVDIYI
jgi:hypothetical protein